MVNKKGIVRIIEASVAILIILSVVLVVSERKKLQIESDLSERITPLLEEIAKNGSMREAIIRDNETNNDAENLVMDFLKQRIKETFIGYNVTICNYTLVCGLRTYPTEAKGNIYSGERVISTTLENRQFNPKKIKIFLWIKR
ncbi:MAG: hypothetical protein N3D20_00265 [Candidatus Pacearchaeota archaeon]|nr:hypothetical protein [Candidatus Pacearchaeota archaeon]